MRKFKVLMSFCLLGVTTVSISSAAFARETCVRTSTQNVVCGTLIESQVQSTDISGRWRSAHGHVYQVTQTGNDFTWSVVLPIRESASGTIAGDDLVVTWNGDNGPGAARGTVTLKRNNLATKIDWSNGAVFFR